jgi:hypothetical protein
MQLYRGLTLDEVTKRQDELFIELPLEVAVHSIQNECYANCVTKTERDGGQVIVGWRRTSAVFGAALIATLDHHAVWQSPEGELVDISPRVIFFNGQVHVVTDSRVFFMIDPDATFDDPRHARPSKMIPLEPDRFGLLAKACERMERGARFFDAGDFEKGRYEQSKVVELLERHQSRK